MDEPNFWFLLVVALALVSFVYCCRKGCWRQEDDETATLPRRYGNVYHIQQVQEPDENRFSSRTPEIDLSLVTNRNEDTTQSQNNTHPITPPPSYEAAILAPSTPPMELQDRIPSYEDVVNSGILYKGHSGPRESNT